jgi:tetratricopeptide (TPR) repeat protein
MKLKILIAVILSSLSIQAEDMQKYLSYTQSLAKEGKYQEALDRHLWFHDHVLENDRSMYGVRLSFALMYWKKLGEKYPPALVAFKKVRDDKTSLLEEGNGSYDLFVDVHALNRELGEDNKTVELFQKLDREQGDLAKKCWSVVKEVVTNAKEYELVKKYGTAADNERPMNELPMYGGLHNPTVEEDPVYSKQAAELGWKYYYKGDFDTAIKRFNQSWMFNRSNVDALWGFGIIMGQRASEESPKDNLKESVRFLQMAKDRAPDNARIISDLAFSHTVLGHYFKSEERDNAEAQRHFDRANTLFTEAFKIDPKYPPLIANWSVLHFYMGDYQQAKTKADKAVEMGYEFRPGYIKDIEEKLK